MNKGYIGFAILLIIMGVIIIVAVVCDEYERGNALCSYFADAQVQ
jgi:hypothetical protein